MSPEIRSNQRIFVAALKVFSNPCKEEVEIREAGRGRQAALPLEQMSSHLKFTKLKASRCAVQRAKTKRIPRLADTLSWLRLPMTVVSLSAQNGFEVRRL